MRILVTNDDGIGAPGLAALARAVQALGEVYVVAPAVEHSGASHGLTFRQPLRVDEVAGPLGGPAWAVHGTPADCVKIAFGRLLPGRPELVVSGINNGQNLGINTLYSGTVAAAVEAHFQGAQGLALSQGFSAEPDFGLAARVAEIVAVRMTRGPHRPRVWSVNVPVIPPDQVRGLVVTRHSTGGLREVYHDVEPPAAMGDTPAPRAEDTVNTRLYRIAGTFQPHGPDMSWDDYAYDQGYVTVTPLGLDRSVHADMDALRETLKGLDLGDKNTCS